MAHRYTSPLRPQDIGYIARVARVEIDWDSTEIGPWHRGQVFAFKAPLPAALVSQMTLREAD